MPHRVTAATAALAVLVVAACSGSASRHPRSSTPISAAIRPAPVALPALPSALATADPCARADSAFTAASTYLGLAQLGRADEAQRCVRRGGVDRATTASLTAASAAGFYVPTGSTGGTTIRFAPATGGEAVTVTVARSGDRYAVTAVRRG